MHKRYILPGVVAYAFNARTQEAEAGDFWVQGQPGLQSELQDSQGYTEKPCLKNKQTNKQKKSLNNEVKVLYNENRKSLKELQKTLTDEKTAHTYTLAEYCENSSITERDL